MTANERRLTDKLAEMVKCNRTQEQTIDTKNAKIVRLERENFNLLKECERVKAANAKLRREVE